MGWLYLILAGLLEIGFTASLKLSENFTLFWPSVGFFVCSSLSFWLLTKAIEHIPLGTAYAIWTGIGACGTALMGIFVFGEPASWMRIALLLLLVATIIGLKLVSGSKAETKAAAEAPVAAPNAAPQGRM